MVFRRRTYVVRSANPQAARARADARRGTSADRGYDYAWQKHRKVFLAHYPFCIACTAAPSLAVIVDHILPVAQGEQEATGQCDEVFWPSWNHQPLCRLHHRLKTDRHDQRLTVNRRPLLQQLTAEDDADRRQQLLEAAAIWPQWIDLRTGSVHVAPPPAVPPVSLRRL